MAEIPDDLALPTAPAEVAEVGFEGDWDEETAEARGCDFELYDHFRGTRPDGVVVSPMDRQPGGRRERVPHFGTTGAGDYSGFWLVRPDRPVTGEPVVYIGSEGERGVIADDLGDLLWLSAAIGRAHV